MKPKTKKYRLTRQTSGLSAAKASDQVPPEHEAETVRFQAVVDRGAAQTPQSNDAEIPIEGEGEQGELSPRQLRIARRIAQKHGLAPETDLEAVQMLREKGIDPFNNTAIVELATGGKGDGGRIQLPDTRRSGTDLAEHDANAAERRAKEILKIQRDIARRRRIKMMLLVARLTIFVFIPTLISGYYFYAVATPMYSTKSEFLILTAEGGGGGALGGLIPSQFATGQDATATQSYLESKDAMLRLDRDHGFREAFNEDWIDPIQRLDKDASNEDTYKIYKRYVKLGYDPTEGVIRMEVSTAKPEWSETFSKALLTYAEERVDNLSQEKRQDAVRTAEKSLLDAQAKRKEAQERLVNLQEGTVLDPAGEVANIRALISAAEAQLQQKQVALQVQMNNPRPNKARVSALQTEIDILESELAKQNSRLNEAQAGNKSLAEQTAEVRMAEADLATADMILQSSLEAKRVSEIEANRQVRYLTVSVQPIASEDPSYPKAFEDTLLAFLVFAGIYLMLSLTASILREQVVS